MAASANGRRPSRRALDGAPVLDGSGGVVGRVKGRVGRGYVEIERDGGNWFVPTELLATGENAVCVLTLSGEEVALIDLNRRPG